MAQLLLLLLSLTATAAVTNLSLGMLFQLTDSNGVERATGRAIAASSLLAMTHFNSRNSSLIAAFGELGSCDVRLEVHSLSSTTLKVMCGPQYSSSSTGTADGTRLSGLHDLPRHCR